jgi:hypothetical protein
MSAREVPRPFKFHWGGGEIIEKASYTPKLRELLRKLVT